MNETANTNTDPRQIRIEDYDYPLPDHRIAKYPLKERDSSKLLIYNKGEVSQDIFTNLPNYLPKGALMVFNNTRVIQARLHFRKGTPSSDATQNTTGALIEIFLLEPASPIEYQENFASKERCSWYCLVGNSKKWKEGALTRIVDIDGQKVVLSATRRELHGTSWRIDFEWHDADHAAGTTVCSQATTFADILDAMGELPIPPYLNRDTEESDKTTYQTVYSKIKGSVAAPTAGLHFTERVLADLDAHGIEREEVTLHVGAGTFKPVKSDEIGGHEMHTEHIAVRRETIERLIAHNGEAVAVGTTSVRTLESLYWMGVASSQLPATCTDNTSTNHDATDDICHDEQAGEELHVSQWTPYEQGCGKMSSIDALKALLQYMDSRKMSVLHSSTQIIIAPGYEYRIVKRIVTNFHQPKSTLLLLVSAFVNGDWHRIYDYALANDFRFLSYGDSSLLIN